MKIFIKPALLPFMLSAISVAGVLVNTNVIRDIDLTRPMIVETTRVVVANKIEDSAETVSIKSYSYFVDSAAISKLGDIYATEIKTGKDLTVYNIGINKEWDAYEFKVHFSAPLKPDEKISIKIHSTYLAPFEPQPKEIEINGEPFYKWHGNAYILSQYVTLKQKTIVKAPSTKILSYTDTVTPVTVKKQEITYGPYTKVSAYEKAPISAHFYMERTPTVIDRFVRKVTASHFSSTFGVADYNSLVNASPKLTEFNRIQYLLANYRGGVKNTIGGISMHIPADARNIYFTDMIGNISTSAIKKSSTPDKLYLELQPRFPIMGGWKFSCNYGYDSSLSNFLKHDKKTGHYNLKVQPYSDPLDVGIREYELIVILPEGADNVEYQIPFTTKSIDVTKEYSFLDFSGRTKITIRKANANPMYLQPVVVTYSYSNLELLRKPALVAGFFFLIYLMSSTTSYFGVMMKKINTEKN